MRIANQYIVIILLLIACTVSTFGADKYAADFLNYGVGARPLAMGGAFSAVADDASAAYWNPAGLCRVEKISANFMHSYAYDGFASYDSAFGVYPAGKLGTFGGGFVRLSSPDIKITSWNDPDDPYRRPVVDKIVDWSDNGFYVSYGREIFNKVSVGTNVIIISQGANEVGSSFGQSLGVGVLAGPFGPFRFSLHGQNLVGRLNWTKDIDVDGTGDTSETIPMNFKTGTSFGLPIPAASGELLLALDCDTKFDGYESASGFSAGDTSFDIHGGGEFLFMRTVALRLGIEKRQQEKTEFSGGVGIYIRPGRFDFGIDYAILPNPELGTSHRLSASMMF